MSIRRERTNSTKRTKRSKNTKRSRNTKTNEGRSLLGDYRHANILPLTENAHGLVEIVDVSNICLDDRCACVEIHAVHPINSRAKDPFNDPKFTTGRTPQHGATLREIVVKHVSSRRCKPFREIYNDVLDDYGTFTSAHAGARAIWRAIADLMRRQEIVPVKQPGTRFRGGYVRSDSPLLKDLDGQRFLLEQLEDQHSAE
jgi:hypothetical protein